MSEFRNEEELLCGLGLAEGGDCSMSCVHCGRL